MKRALRNGKRDDFFPHRLFNSYIFLYGNRHRRCGLARLCRAGRWLTDAVGAALMGCGLVSYLFARTHSSTISIDGVETLRNFFIITAGIGANMLAGGAMINIGKIRSNGAAFRRYPGKKVISQSFFGRVLVFTIVDPPKHDKPIE